MKPSPPFTQEELRERAGQLLRDSVPSFARHNLEGLLNQRPATLDPATLDAMAAADTWHEALEDGRTLRVREMSTLTRRILAGFRPSELCLKGCQVESPEHPGLHIRRRDAPPGDEGSPVCSLPRDLPHQFCMCFPSDHNRYRRCPECGEVIAVRAAKRHIEAHFGVNRRDPKVLREERRATIVAGVAEWLRRNPAWGQETAMPAMMSYYNPNQVYRPAVTLRDAAQRYVAQLRNGQEGSFWLGVIKEASRRHNVPKPPTTLRELRANGVEPQAQAGETVMTPATGERNP